MDKTIAKEMVREIDHILGLLNEFLYNYQECLDEIELKKIKRGIARMMNVADVEIIDVIVEQYPDLDPLSDK